MKIEELELAVAIGDRIAERIESRFSVMPTLTLDQAAEALGVSNEKMRQLCNDGKIPFIRVDKFYRIKPGDINHYLNQHYHREGRP
ncbi:helix-turn-helix domain-containing protein [Victivallis sp. Marseille-Q1083]|uniref:helix-turn-helix domain-containing protein n=1 Tax=Victivallis sp. Marseille-Q1083 TaxID=2717288 RepID=UPI00158D4170|nr:helix-turn-helix domain-containing protein [Victivallis sp. Marseille-Q1083]